MIAWAGDPAVIGQPSLAASELDGGPRQVPRIGSAIARGSRRARADGETSQKANVGVSSARLATQQRQCRPPRLRRLLRRAGRQHPPGHRDGSRAVSASYAAAIAAAAPAATAAKPSCRVAILPRHRNDRRLQLYLPAASYATLIGPRFSRCGLCGLAAQNQPEIFSGGLNEPPELATQDPRSPCRACRRPRERPREPRRSQPRW